MRSPALLTRLWSALHGHLYTVGPRLWGGRREKPPATAWATRFRDGERTLTITGLLSEASAARTLLIVLHGCGGAPTSHYAVAAARHFLEQGVSVLRLSWRGSDLAGEDIYHAAQTADLHAALADPALAHYERVWVLGYSLGGHCCLHFAHETRDRRVAAVATVCPVLHLLQTTAAIDRPALAPYRRYLLSGLYSNYSPYAQRGLAPTALAEVRRATTFRLYDSLTVVPRYGFASVDDYYTRACASRVLAKIALPTLIVAARNDPLLPWQIADSMKDELSSAIELRWAERGGHTGFPEDLDLGERAPLGLEAQVHAWLARHTADPHLNG